MKALLLFPVLLSLVSCTTNSSIPDAKELDHYHQSAEAVMKPERDDLERRRASGEITEAAYQAQKAMLDKQVAARATDAAWTRHALAESERKMTGIPTPDNPVAIDAPTSGSNSGMPTQGSYRRFNEQDMGMTANSQVPREFFRGYTPGGAVRGNNTGF